MKLNIEKFITYCINKEMLISHFENCVIYVSKQNDIPEKVMSSIKNKYGEDFLKKSDYIIFFKSDDGSSFTDDRKTKIFKFTDRALGKSSNTLAKDDFKTLESSCLFIKVELFDPKNNKEKSE